MATPFQALVAEIRALDGAPKVTYPEGSAAHPVVERVLRIRRGTQAPVFGQADPDTAQFPNNTLVQQVDLKNDGQMVEVYRKWKVLPGPILISIKINQDSGLPILVARQEVSGSDTFTEGLIIPGVFTVQSIAVGSGGKSLVTLTANHGLPPQAWIAFSSTNSTPVLDGNKFIVDVPAPNQVLIGVDVTVAGTAGFMQGINPISRELESTGNKNVNVKVESMVAVADVATYNEDVQCKKDYPFPDFLRSIDCYRDLASSSGISSSFNNTSNFSFNGTVALDIQNGYHGPCDAMRHMLLTRTAPDNTAILSTFVMPSSGRVIVQGGGQGAQMSLDDSGGFNLSGSHSINFGGHPIPAVLTGPSPTLTIHGTGQAEFTLNLTPSIPTHFTVGEIINIVDQPQQMLGGLFWQQFWWEITVPYTSGEAPP